MRKQIKFIESGLTESEQEIVEQGFAQLSKTKHAPEYKKQNFKWVLYNDSELKAALTASTLWDWLYIDELWVSEPERGQGFGKSLIAEAERFAIENNLSGIWLWTQSWQAEDFYKKIGFLEFTKFENFPKGHQRIGLRKELNGD